MSTVQEGITSWLSQHFRTAQEKHFLLAVSGGGDSMAMLHAFGQQASLPARITVAHVHHGLRGEDTEADAQLVQNWCEEYELPFHLLFADVATAQRRRGRGLEEAARDERRRTLIELADQIHADAVLTAHTRDDHAETVLMNVLRGTGLKGLGGMKSWDGQWGKPLLMVSKAELRDYCRKNGVPWREDETNTDFRFRRNFVRHGLLPEVREHLNPSVDDALVRLAEITAEENAFAHSLALQAYKALNAVPYTLPASGLAQLHKAIRRRVVRMLVDDCRGDLQDVRFELVEEALVAVADRTSFSETLPGGEFRLEADGDGIRVKRVREEKADPIAPIELPVPGEAMAGSAWKLKAAVTQDRSCSSNPYQAKLDMDSIRLPLNVRSVIAGDRMHPLGAPGTRKLQDIFVDRKVLVGVRSATPIICDQQGIVWVAGVALAHRVRLTDKTKAVLSLTIERNEAR